MGVSLSDQISALRSDMKDSLATLVIEMTRQDAQQTKDSHQDTRLDIHTLASHLIHAGDSGPALVATLNILRDLRFEGMSDRYTNIRKAHTGTFEWVFVNQLADWLRSEGALFWVTGKPGSGKSTLLKRLVDSPRTSLLLRQWSRSDRPIVASYFYWIKGTRLQRSDMGLLRCVLYDYLRQCPSATAHVFPEFWANELAHVPRIDSIDWKRDDLIQAFDRLAKYDTKSAHLCLFIDGLDEYEGDLQDLIETVQYLSRLKIKICVASRPWNVFEETFGKSPHLRMQDLNKPDIEVYVRDHLFLRHDFQHARVATSDMDTIMSEITEKSQGVFLWVYLVVRSLVEGLRNLDPMSLLMRRLSAFPSDLNDFFRDIFMSLEPIYRNKTAKMFLLTLETTNSLQPEVQMPTGLTTLTHWYLDELEESPDLPISLHAINVDEDTIVEYSTTASLRINGRCKGLLEMVPGRFMKPKMQQRQNETPYWYNVTFLHRTVADFFDKPDIQQLLHEWLEEDLDTWSLICRATLAEIKTILGLKAGPSNVDLVRPTVTRFLSAASHHEKSSESALTTLLDELSKVLVGHNLCHSLGFARLAVHYDLLIYIRSSPSIQQALQQPEAKIAILEGIEEAAFRYPIADMGKGITGQMICLIHSVGAKVTIGRHAQDILSEIRKQDTNDEEYITMVRRLTNTAYFELAQSTDPSFSYEFAGSSFNRSLFEIIGPIQTYELVKFCLQSAKEKKQKLSSQVAKQDQKKAKRLSFHKMFGWNRRTLG